MKKTAQTAFWIALTIFLFPAGIAAAGPRRACVEPDASQLAGQEKAGAMPVIFYPVADTHGALRWAFASWEGPPEGTAFVVGCDGRPIASVGIGLVQRVHAGPIVNNHGTVELIVVPDSGTNISDHSVALLQFDGHRVSKLWTHDSDDESEGPVRLQDGAYGTEAFSEKYNWHYNRDGTKIVVYGNETEKETPETGRPIAHIKRKREAFCLLRGIFAPCR